MGSGTWSLTESLRDRSSCARQARYALSSKPGPSAECTLMAASTISALMLLMSSSIRANLRSLELSAGPFVDTILECLDAWGARLARTARTAGDDPLRFYKKDSILPVGRSRHVVPSLDET